MRDMKRILKALLYSFVTIACLIVIIIIFLYVYYSVLERKQIRLTKELENKTLITIISESQVTVNQKAQSLNLLPVPKKVVFTNGSLSFPKVIVYSAPDSLKNNVSRFFEDFPGIKASYSSKGGNLEIRKNEKLPVQGYILDIQPNKMIIEYSSIEGVYYAFVSLKVLRQNYSGTIPCVHIEDSPDLSVRGLMLDISRDKVPAMNTLLQIVQLLADLKYNHLELYIEGFSFAYPSFKNLWEGKETPITGDEIKTLDAFCKSRYIELVPNQNSLGHMMAWLATDQYKDLAECPKGYKILGIMNMKGTLNPTDPRSIELLTKMTDDLLPNFTSSNFNVNLDEPFELGKGRSKSICDKKGVGVVYLEYAGKMNEIAKGKNKKMLMWADIVLKHPELIPQIPKDITLLDWGYESSYPYEKHCILFQKSGLDYMVCPGTNSWTSITGRTDNMLATIETAALNGTRYGAKGMLLTDWGDMGHWQYLPVSYAGYTAGAALSWNSSSGKDMNLASFLNSYVFRDKHSVMGDLVLDLGRYNKYEEFPMFNMTTTMLALEFGMRDKILISEIFDKVTDGIGEMMQEIAPEMTLMFNEKYENRHSFDYQGINDFLSTKESMLQKVRLDIPDSSLVRNEYLNSIRLIRLGVDLQYYIDFHKTMNIEEEKSKLQDMKELGIKYLEENEKYWNIRNKSGGYDRSVLSLNSLIRQIDDRSALLDKSPAVRKFNRFLEKIGTAGAVLYLKSGI